ncbi:hypothetical protein O1611_g4718 [Lasiodiplodia mahajangana]|uniref:Uncharacterized protein n=1 Tax=Lasiodiplodia mahajangana TaxID=1108764 RepID=A0ACC2JN51_9PEZI|nr:hypothetical protein O1611_g4718 [Lasiodiplodia mahajangana]
MNPKIYRPLGRERREFRLARIKPTPHSEHENHHIEVIPERASLNNTPTFTAFSYTSGDEGDEEDETTILINEIRTPTRTNLHAALYQLLKRSIFTLAETVYCWLGPSTDDIDAASLMLKRIAQEVKDCGLTMDDVQVIRGGVGKRWPIAFSTPDAEEARLSLCKKLIAYEELESKGNSETSGSPPSLCDITLITSACPGRPLYTASDPRDIIFGALGCVADTEALGLQVEYKKPVNQVFAEATNTLLRQRKQYFLGFCSFVKDMPGLPSWVPYWKRLGEFGVTLYPINYAIRFAADGGLLDARSNVDIGDWRVLRTCSWYVDVVMAVMEPVKREFIDPYCGHVYSLENQKRWISKIVEFFRLDSSEQADEVAVWRMVVQDEQRPGERTTAVWQGLAPRVFRQSSLDAGELTPDEIKLIEDPRCGGTVEGFKRRCLFIMEACFRFRTLFKTSTGKIGLGPEVMLPGDIVTILHGNDAPIILRPESEQYHSYVGDAYVHAIMDGEFAATEPELRCDYTFSLAIADELIIVIAYLAISTLLQQPIVRAGLLPHTSASVSSTLHPPNIRDIPPVTLTNITHVDAGEFEPYITQVGALYKRLRAVKESENEEAFIFRKTRSNKEEFAAIFDDENKWLGKGPLVARRGSVSVSLFSPAEAPRPIRKLSSEFPRAIQVPSPLSTVPSVFFDEDFRLENPRTFDVVSERSEVVRPLTRTLHLKALVNGNVVASRKALATNGILQDKLSWYMDTIEIYLTASILTASTTFFTALSSLQELHSQAAYFLERIKAFRKELEALDRKVTNRGLNIVQAQRRQKNLQQLHHVVLQLNHIIHGVATCKSLIDNGEIEMALENIDFLENLVAGKTDQLKSLSKFDGWDIRVRDLKGAIALQGVNADLSTLRSRIGKAYETRFLILLIGDLQRHSQVSLARTQEVLIRWVGNSVRFRSGHTREPAISPSYMNSIGDLRPELLESLVGLRRVKHFTAAATAYREAALREIRNLVWRLLPSSNDDDADSVVPPSSMTSSKIPAQHQKSFMPTRNLQTLEPEGAERLLVEIYIGVTETLRRLSTQTKLLLDVASSLGDESSSSITVRDSSIAAVEIQEIHEAIGLPNLLGQAVDIAQDEVVKLLRIRSEQSTHLSIVWFIRYFTLNLYFANECESISGRSGTTLKIVVNGQVKDFVQHYGDAEKQKLARHMESEQWEAADFSEEDAARLNRILSCSTEDPTEWLDRLKIWIPYSNNDLGSDGAGDAQPNSNAKAGIRNACIDEETFILPNPAILCMNSLAHFLELIVGIPSMTSDIAASLVSYLLFFNSRCIQLILGAGARRSAGLRSITSKHLVLASQALAFIATLISHVREFVRRHAGNNAAASTVMEFDKVKRLYQEHQDGIHDKIIEIMSLLAASHVRTMKNIDWDNGQKNLRPYMASLAKDTASLHRILRKNVSERTARRLMTLVFASYKEQLGDAFWEADPKTELGRDSMLQDVEFFQSKLGKVDGCGDTGEYLSKIIKSKQVKNLAPVAPAATEREEKDAEDTTGSAEIRDCSRDEIRGEGKSKTSRL